MACAVLELFGRKTRLWPNILVTIVISIASSGCGTTTPPGVIPDNFEAASRDVIGVRTLTANYQVRFTAGHIPGSEHERLDEFIRGFARNRPESLRISLSGAASPAEFRAVANILVADGVEPKYIVLKRSSALAGAYRAAVALNVERAVAVQPYCPGWTDHISAPTDNSTNPNFGCSDQNNFASMVADPHDLREGESNIYEDAERGAKSVADYRADKVKDLPPINEQFQVIPSGSK